MGPCLLRKSTTTLTLWRSRSAHSGSVFPQLKDELKGYSTSSGALRFSIGQPLPVPLVEKLIAVRLQQAFPA